MILRPCDWHGAPFGRLNATPPDGKPITQYADRDQAMLEVAKAVRAAAERLAEKASRKGGVDGDFRRVDANHFTASIYRNGQAVSRCTIFLGDRSGLKIYSNV